MKPSAMIEQGEQSLPEFVRAACLENGLAYPPPPDTAPYRVEQTLLRLALHVRRLLAPALEAEREGRDDEAERLTANAITQIAALRNDISAWVSELQAWIQTAKARDANG